MKNLGLNKIREEYLNFFESKGHLRIDSFSLIPKNDPSILLINAGMVPLKPYFTGELTPPSKRVTTCQKCVRTLDIDRIGLTSRHGTFFEMLGNFSFGDYFKKEVTAWAWEFLTKVMEIPAELLWVSIYEEDDEAFDIWTQLVGVPADKIVRLGKEDNFWELTQGPCGPCSEIYVDRGEQYGCDNPNCGVGCECDRYVEVWNLVFTQFYKDENGEYSKLAHPNIDTGMGLERLACIMQGVDNIFEVDTFQKITQKVCESVNVKYKDSEKTDISLRIISDHIRSTTFLISDGVMPSNEGRGYVLRRLLRRAARHGKLLGMNKAFLSELAKVVINECEFAYPELRQKQDFILKVIEVEEHRFNETIDQGLSMLSSVIDQAINNGETILAGDVVFKLYDTYGFPIDLTREIAEEKSLSIDETKFLSLMQEQKQRARSAASDDSADAGWSKDVFSELDPTMTTTFVGYNALTLEKATVLAIINDGKLENAASAGDHVSIILDKTVFYGESGGQAGDNGSIFTLDGGQFDVIDTKKRGDGKVIHIGNVTEGIIAVGESTSMAVNQHKRKATMRHHSAAHLLQQALRDVLGSHVTQAGSSVDENRMRFDFTHFSALTDEEIALVQASINAQILEADDVVIKEMNIKEAQEAGAMALFGEKYGSTVRTVKMGDYSFELCGGCHVSNTANIGLIKITSEAGVASGIRRIEAVCGGKVLEYIENQDKTLKDTSDILKTKPSELTTRANVLMGDIKSLQRDVESLNAKLANSSVDKIVEGLNDIDGDGIQFVSATFEGMGADGLRIIGDTIKSKVPNAFIFLTGIGDSGVIFVSMATKIAVEKGAHAGNVVREAAKVCGGGGGGKADSAQAGGKDRSKVKDAVEKAFEVFKAQTSK